MGFQQVQFEIKYLFTPGYTHYTPLRWPANFPASASMPLPLQGISFPVTSLNAKVPKNCVVVPFKTKMIAPEN
jgi:hypothetical protein